MARHSVTEGAEAIGQHTNPRRYEKLYGFVSNVIAVAAGPIATPLWAVGLAAVNPAAGRPNGLDTTIYTLDLENDTGNDATAWLEIGGVAITVPFHISNGQTLSKDWPAGLNTGDQDIDINASVAGIVAQVTGTEE